MSDPADLLGMDSTQLAIRLANAQRELESYERCWLPMANDLRQKAADRRDAAEAREAKLREAGWAYVDAMRKTYGGLAEDGAERLEWSDPHFRALVAALQVDAAEDT